MKRLLCFLIPVLCLTFAASDAIAKGKGSRKKTAAPSAQTEAPATKKAPGCISRVPYIGAIILNGNTGDVLFEDHADAPGYPASTQKLMTLLVTLQKIQEKKVNLTDSVAVSVKASKTGGSQVYLDPKETFPLEDLLYALMIQSANDAAVAIAEHVAGSTEAFVEMMNAKAKELGMKNTRFTSPHGLPPDKRIGQQNDVSTARDMGILCCAVCRQPDALKYTSIDYRQFRAGTPKPFDMRTHNPFIKPSTKMAGCDGLKTGYTATAGWSIAVSCLRNGRRVVVYVLGSENRKLRDAKARELVNQGFTLLPPAPATPAPAPAPTKPVPQIPL